MNTTDTDAAVAQRYSAAANDREAALCCPVDYDPRYLAIIPDEIIERDYGCGDPTAYVQAGDVVLDLGSGGGKVCYIAAQIVGAEGRVIGVDCNQEMLALARSYQDTIAQELGYANVEFRYGRIQDLATDLTALDATIAGMGGARGGEPGQALELLRRMQDLKTQSPMVASDSIDCVVSNCVLNLVNGDDRKQLFQELYRVLKRGGRAAISDVVCDEDVPKEMQADGHLWSGCIAGAWREDLFIKEFEEAGFYGITIDKYQTEPWQVINGIQFRSVTVVAHKGKEGPCWERNQAVIYRGPFSHVKDDDGHVYPRGQRIAVCDKTFQLLMRPPYEGMFQAVEPLESVPLRYGANVM
ncbi:MAG: methyltransferase domain-containing protein [Planctomycetota bacterium]